MKETERLQMIQLARQMMKEKGEEYDGTLEQAIRGADQYTDTYGIKAMVIRKKNRYDWVSEYYFDTYKYKGKIYHKTEVSYEEK